MASCNTSTLLSSASCFSCYPKGFFLPLKLVLLSRILEAKGVEVPSISTLLERGACFSCLTPGQLQIIKLQLLCNLLGGNTLYGYEIPSGFKTSTGDPVILPPFARENPYVLAVEFDEAIGSTLTWSWPFDQDSAVFGTAQVPDPIPIVGLWLQRSSTATNTPLEPDFLAETLANAPTPDPNWINLTSWGAYPNITDLQSAALEYIDASIPANNSYYAYRLIMIIGPIPDGEFAGLKYQLDWNLVMTLAQYTLTLNISGQPRLTWNAPEL